MGRGMDHHSVKAHLPLNLLPQIPKLCARHGNLRKNAFRISQPPDQLPVPFLRLRTHKLCGGGNGVFRGRLSRQQIIEIIGSQKKGFRPLKLPGLPLLQRHELIDGVEALALDPGAGIELLLANDLVNLFLHPSGAAIPVRHGVPDPFSLPVQKNKVHPPGVYAQAYRDFSQLPTPFHSVFDLLKEPFRLPDERAVFARHTVGKPVNLLQHHPAVLSVGQNMTSAGRPYVDRQIILLHILSFPGNMSPKTFRRLLFSYFTGKRRTKKEHLLPEKVSLFAGVVFGGT